MEWLLPWALIEQTAVDNLTSELTREVPPTHPLYGKTARAIARRIDSDDVLFQVDDVVCPYAQVHLTWGGQPESSPDFPYTMRYRSLQNWVNEVMLPDRDEYQQSGKESATSDGGLTW